MLTSCHLMIFFVHVSGEEVQSTSVSNRTLLLSKVECNWQLPEIRIVLITLSKNSLTQNIEMWGFFCPSWQKRFWSFLRGRMKDQGVKTAARSATTPPPPVLHWFPKIHILCVGVCICQREPPKTALTLTPLSRPSLTPELRHSARRQEKRFFFFFRKTWLTNWYFTSFWEKVVFIGVVLYPLFSSNVGWTWATVTLWCGLEIKRKATLNKRIWKDVNLL